MSLRLGIDYGGTNSKLLLARDTGAGLERVRDARVPTPRGAAAIAELAGVVLEFLGVEHPDAFAVTVAGIIDASTGRVVTSTNMPWLERVDLAGELAARIGVPGVAVQDGVAAATAEAALGAGHGVDDVFVIALGTGIAGAHVLDGAVRRGAHGGAGEVGHIAAGDGRLCSCGQRGCLEAYLGGRQIAALWDEARGLPPGTAESAGGAKAVVAAADAGDADAIAILDRATTELGRSLLGIVATVDPALIVIGGGLAQARASILDPAVRKAVEGATFHQLPPIVPAAFGVWAGAWGAALAAAGATQTGALPERGVPGVPLAGAASSAGVR